jgi:Rrf2 family nitric oxide-sensitive transcriptional repressor
MRLTQFSDYGLRIVIMLGSAPDRLVSVKEVAATYGISYHHLTKVANLLTALGVVEAVRGRNGGLRLAREAADINVGWLVRRTEADLTLVECFDDETNSCPISPECRLRHALEHALRAFLEVLDGYTVADLVRSSRQRERLVQLWRASA